MEPKSEIEQVVARLKRKCDIFITHLYAIYVV